MISSKNRLSPLVPYWLGSYCGSFRAARLASMSSSERAYILSQSGMNSRSPPTISSQPVVMSRVATLEASTGLLTPKITWAPEAAK